MNQVSQSSMVHKMRLHACISKDMAKPAQRFGDRTQHRLWDSSESQIDSD